jgi:hypothetical protein
MRIRLRMLVALAALGCLGVFADVGSAATPVVVGDGWHGFFFFGAGSVPSESPFTFTAIGPVVVTVTDSEVSGDRFSVSDGSTLLGLTSVPNQCGSGLAFTPDAGLAHPAFSHGQFALGAGAHSIGIVFLGGIGFGNGYIRVDAAGSAPTNVGTCPTAAGFNTPGNPPVCSGEFQSVPYLNVPLTRTDVFSSGAFLGNNRSADAVLTATLPASMTSMRYYQNFAGPYTMLCNSARTVLPFGVLLIRTGTFVDTNGIAVPADARFVTGGVPKPGILEVVRVA